jgi:23S rRNA (adenine2030-N6)-methyltransferase
MLSYRHAFHAGNHADVLKHITLVLVLEYITRKDKPFLYVDTHAGAGLYDLRSDWAQKNREYESGIGRIMQDTTNLPGELDTYRHIVQQLNPHGKLYEYPGSPWIAQAILRPQDRARLFELHPNEYQHLHELFSSNRQFKLEQRDGFQALNAVLPPVERRAVIFIDPPYEVKSDYKTVIDSVKTAYRKFSSGVYLIWYPALNPALATRLEKDFIASGLRNILLAELSIGNGPANTSVKSGGMTSSGMIIINPPWQLHQSLTTVLHFLQKELAASNGSHRLQQLVAE